MIQTHIITTTVVAELFHSIGLEVTIFAISIALALIFRGVTFYKKTSRCQQSLNASHPKPCRADRARSGSPGARKETKHLPTPAQAMAPAKPVVNDVSQKIDSMINFAHRRQCADALVMYQVIRANGDHKAIRDVPMRHQRYNQRAIRGPADVFAALIQCAGNVGRPDLVEALFDDMSAAGIERSLELYETTMKMLASKKCYAEALSVCSRLEADGLEPSPVTLSCLISFAVEVGKCDRAIDFFNRLSACSMPSIRACMTILRVHSRRQDWQKSLAVIRDMQSRKAPLDSLVLNIVLSTVVSACELDAAKSLLQEFANMGIADVVSYNTVMKGLAQQKSGGQALSLLDEMCKAGVIPNAITFNTAIDAAVRSLQVEDAWGVLKQMLDAGLAPDKFTCTTLMKGLQSGATSVQLSVILDVLKNVAMDSNSPSCRFLFRSVFEAAVEVHDLCLKTKLISQMREQRDMLSSQEYHRLLRVLMHED